MRARGSWQVVGGTSLGAPAWAGIIAIVDQGRALAGKASLDGPTQTLPSLYAAASTDFNSVTARPLLSVRQRILAGVSTRSAAVPRPRLAIGLGFGVGDDRTHDRRCDRQHVDRPRLPNRPGARQRPGGQHPHLHVDDQSQQPAAKHRHRHGSQSTTRHATSRAKTTTAETATRKARQSRQDSGRQASSCASTTMRSRRDQADGLIDD